MVYTDAPQAYLMDKTGTYFGGIGTYKDHKMTAESFLSRLIFSKIVGLFHIVKQFLSDYGDVWIPRQKV